MSGVKTKDDSTKSKTNNAKALLNVNKNLLKNSETNEELQELIESGQIGNNNFGGITEDQEISESQIITSTIDNTVIGGSTASSAGFTNVSILDTTVSTSKTTGALIVAGGIGVSENSYFGEELHAGEFHGCGRHITSILGENVIGNVTAEPNYLIIKVGQHCVVPPNIAPNINAVGMGSGHYLFGYNSFIGGGKNSNNYSRLSAIIAGESNTLDYNANHSILWGRI